ncbi:MAG: hypothetical protein AAB570_00070 [Patescibacteria group bacterium]
MAEREGARTGAAEAEARHDAPRAEGPPREARPIEAGAEAPRATDAERTRVMAEAVADATEVVEGRDRATSLARRTGGAAKRAVKSAARTAGKAASSSSGWLANELVSDWNRTALGFGERMRKLGNFFGRVFDPIIRMSAAMEEWGGGYPPFSWFHKKVDATEALGELLPDYDKGDGKKGK